MKYGILLNKNNENIGDDIQAYATSQFLPHVDYFVDREFIDDFQSENGEPVAVIMNAWYMWKKWNWPPSKYIVPKFVGFHYADHQLARQPGSPVKYEFLNGIGGDYLKAYGPIGCRDRFTCDMLTQLGIDSYFSGCITMTLPKMPVREDRGTYICLVDLEERVVDKIKSILKDQKIELKVMTHNRDRNSELTWEDRQKQVVELLTTYQNARCVVTKRLHCALPCLALETPVFLIKEMENDIRFDPYYDFLYRTTVTRFMSGDYDYDFMSPPPNKEDYKEYRQKLIEEVQEFVHQMESENRSVDELNRTHFTQEEVIFWRHDVMKKAMNEWLDKYRKVQIDNKKLQKKNQELKKKIEKLEKERDSSFVHQLMGRLKIKKEE